MTTCCDKEITTPCCPYCGKHIYVDTSLQGLLQHLKKQEKGLATRQLHGNAFKEKVNKWSCWIKELEKVLQK